MTKSSALQNQLPAIYQGFRIVSRRQTEIYDAVILCITPNLVYESIKLPEYSSSIRETSWSDWSENFLIIREYLISIYRPMPISRGRSIWTIFIILWYKRLFDSIYKFPLRRKILTNLSLNLLSIPQRINVNAFYYNTYPRSLVR